MPLSCTIFELYWVICRQSPTLTYLHVFGAPVGVTPLEFRQGLWYQKTRLPAMGYRVALLPDPKFSQFDTISACDRETDGQTGRQTHYDITAYTALAYSVAR